MTTTSIGEGAKADITERIQTLGANILAVRPGQSRFRGRSSGQDRQSLKYEDAMVLRERAQNILLVTPEVSSRSQIKHGNKTTIRRLSAQPRSIRLQRTSRLRKGRSLPRTMYVLGVACVR